MHFCKKCMEGSFSGQGKRQGERFIELLQEGFPLPVNYHSSDIANIMSARLGRAR